MVCWPTTCTPCRASLLCAHSETQTHVCTRTSHLPPCSPAPARSWAPLLSGRAYQNYPSDAYADPQQPYKPQQMYFGDNLCRLVALKNK